MNRENVPRHIAIIMDGNGRWAKARGLPRTEGHKEGLKTAKGSVLDALGAGVSYISLDTFSTENWKRAEEEVGILMGIIPASLRNELPFYDEHKIRVVHSGFRDALPTSVLSAIDEVSLATKNNNGITVNLAINYGGRDEIVRAALKLRDSNLAVTETSLRAALDQPGIPDPDLIIRTGGEYRLSNFLLWQSAYSELYFSEKLWPDFSSADFENALENYCSRERRFGGIQ